MTTAPSPATAPASAAPSQAPRRPALLVLADGLVLRGEAFGASGTAIGEVVFNTGMTGYQEVMTDPSYSGQLVTFTYPELGNTGVNGADQEADAPHVRGVIARQLAPVASNWRSEQSLEAWLVRHGVVGISGVDTRALVRHLREGGAINGAISTDGSAPEQLLEQVRSAPSMAGLNLAERVTTREPYDWSALCPAAFDQRRQPSPATPYRVVAIDFGIKRAILERLAAHGCAVTVLPASATLEQVLALRPEGVFLSNGPGDPAAVTSGIALAKGLVEQHDLPVFGICLGHQILGLALGGSTYKLGYGHRGLNHPCGSTGLVEITSQNHGFALDADSLPADQVEVTHFNLNDRTVAALAHRSQPLFGVQYHPEASPGPHDADHHFARFVALMHSRRG
ncbi:glutamine-hydrolyzing carbamoyl-phosphate synthase small subunit [Vulcanococcus limneticus Candia 3F8]|uniref:glutamine-hydrolyzing carbamoyl-phosphate synthase small subunit n=1 Tax=Vulcanococcus limneticus TaxID=2170428 RepID=UPI000B98D783|nr:glutamine-hydrolyzing carbamoyl-phosphate synthase small subunit [Vulcanococcus limneticus]MCP9791512.1 glutamine-hydrolyzing carbamoyl-phosphate synthase small subunit [Vulcanococcus limneticus MW73D5]MCP9893195.1 glutamine-hydrolyzing carbamoyl-phosphate synthase small subunit [Vulcanococcus limneticus Candia 3F8]MCP9896902.1 glutamine-hydrolyzing carbamoyl-phosphate synthase small subunit [Vulcanococcus limneticus Candia 3B3]